MLVLGAVPLIEISSSRNVKELCLKFLQGWCRTDQHWTLCVEPNMTEKYILFSNSNCSNSYVLIVKTTLTVTVIVTVIVNSRFRAQRKKTVWMKI